MGTQLGHVDWHHNLQRNSIAYVRHDGVKSVGNKVWNNILLTPKDACQPLYSSVAFAATYFAEVDYNLVVSKAVGQPVPTYKFIGGAFPLADFRAKGYEVHTQFVAGGPAAIFDDVASYKLKPEYASAGRDHDEIGPRDVPSILKLSQPGATGPELLIALENGGQQPEPEPTPPGPSAGAVALRAAIRAALATPGLDPDVKAALEAAIKSLPVETP
jgi:hypothetical protein